MRLTRIGGPTMLVELGGWRILVDPTFDPPGRRYAFALGTSSTKTTGPFVTAADIGPVDVILLSHEHHADNLDDAGRALLPGATHVITTHSGARRLGMVSARGLQPDESILLEDEGKEALRVLATPGRHGPPLSRAIVGDVIGFTLRRQHRPHPDLWITGDTVLTRKLLRVAGGMTVDVAIVNAGGVGFPATGPLTYTMTGRDVVRFVEALRAGVAVPAHYNGWSHFRDGEEGLRRAIDMAPTAVRERVRWLPDGVAVDL
ncbi:MBL fold metallo-hydrolase [Microbacterium sp. ET2]|uniref:MBL fold metallo-hydrolase n=1 Tax=Microbacterium albipurpureum TaxID=3050384 RepID=UPI00259C7FB7|nr:MBL fold metallo-hydrolase [Microbacterium sp. ET2 (Ac-2212)]WJL94939.1 MBL fold metallo-hydrolase [Microbacterium sp. ET2 (Ac-2212)]